jgi:hypothetical protein
VSCWQALLLPFGRSVLPAAVALAQNLMRHIRNPCSRDAYQACVHHAQDFKQMQLAAADAAQELSSELDMLLRPTAVLG